ncbi:RYamide receptor [Schistosoma japonicum]|uniref:RYamide receptor n=1 Tax=Schistosoma japonicum TaxID=6182 RepID=A0A4Z2CRE7_SCHJA|nr:RYamide receptor [Schistosoma japonicum]
MEEKIHHTTDEINHLPFTKGEVTFLVIIFAAVVILAVVGNTIVCILLRFRYCNIFKCFTTTLGCKKKSSLSKSHNHNNANNNIDPWVDECQSSQHECSCGKTCTVQTTHRYVIFKSMHRQQDSSAGNYTGSITLSNNIYALPNEKRNQLTTKQKWKANNYLRGMRTSSITSLFLFNLSLADILMAVLCIPMNVITEIVYLWWPLGEPLCKIVPYAQGVSVFVSALTHVLISWDRFVLVFFPLRPRMTQRKAVCLLVGVWILALIIPLPVPIVNRTVKRDNETFCVEDWSLLLSSIKTINMDNFTSLEQIKNEITLQLFNKPITLQIDVVYTIILMILQYFLPLGMICGTYTAIGIKVNRLQTPGERDSARDQKLTKAKRKMVKMLTLVALMYGLSQLPRHTIYLHGLINREFWFKSYSIKAWAVANFARDSSTCYNPFIYAWINKNFRQDIYHLFYSCFLSCFTIHLPNSLRSIKTKRFNQKIINSNNNKNKKKNKNIQLPIIHVNQPTLNETSSNSIQFYPINHSSIHHSEIHDELSIIT